MKRYKVIISIVLVIILALSMYGCKITFPKLLNPNEPEDTPPAVTENKFVYDYENPKVYNAGYDSIEVSGIDKEAYEEISFYNYKEAEGLNTHEFVVRNDKFFDSVQERFFAYCEDISIEPLDTERALAAAKEKAEYILRNCTYKTTYEVKQKTFFRDENGAPAVAYAVDAESFVPINDGQAYGSASSGMMIVFTAYQKTE